MSDQDLLENLDLVDIEDCPPQTEVASGHIR